MMVVEPESHVPVGAHRCSRNAPDYDRLAFRSVRSKYCAIAAQPAAIFANVSEMQAWTK
jgi:3'-phosphoadenosine 5'-phosphosulfate (PAPS) 3'-phosphatase